MTKSKHIMQHQPPRAKNGRFVKVEAARPLACEPPSPVERYPTLSVLVMPREYWDRPRAE